MRRPANVSPQRSCSPFTPRPAARLRLIESSRPAPPSDALFLNLEAMKSDGPSREHQQTKLEKEKRKSCRMMPFKGPKRVAASKPPKTDELGHRVTVPLQAIVATGGAVDNQPRGAWSRGERRTGEAPAGQHGRPHEGATPCFEGFSSVAGGPSVLHSCYVSLPYLVACKGHWFQPASNVRAESRLALTTTKRNRRPHGARGPKTR